MRAVVLVLLVPGTAVAGGGVERDQERRISEMGRGTMVEVGMGLGKAWFDGDESVVGVGFSLGSGSWVTREITLGVLASGVRLESEGVRFWSVVLGPSVQYWPIEHAWVGAGVGVGFTVFDADGGTNGSDYREPCAAARVRAGVMVWSRGEHALGITAELTPMKTGLFDTTTGAVMLSYEHL